MEQNGQEQWSDPDYWRDKHEPVIDPKSYRQAGYDPQKPAGYSRKEKYVPKQHSAAYWRRKYAPKKHSASYWRKLYEGNGEDPRDFLHKADKIARKILYYVAWGLCLYKWYQYFTGR